ncbi:hypothetical protein N7523_002921 [Penicillium sp. IBT 18751x]|nr:hypothetical protein N7523_002921 [Penicillium sp. IBT 18751x]
MTVRPKESSVLYYRIRGAPGMYDGRQPFGRAHLLNLVMGQDYYATQRKATATPATANVLICRLVITPPTNAIPKWATKTSHRLTETDPRHKLGFSNLTCTQNQQVGPADVCYLSQYELGTGH